MAEWVEVTSKDIAVKLAKMCDQRPLPEPGQLGIEKWWQQI